MNWEDYESFLRNEIASQPFSEEFKEELLEILNERREEIRRLKESYNSRLNLDSIHKLKRRFPLVNDNNPKLVRFEDIPNMGTIILVSYYLEKNKKRYYDILIKVAKELYKYINGEESSDGEKYLKRMLWVDTPERKEEVIRRLKEIDINKEIVDYQSESEAYNDRNINALGLLTNDAFKCLEDFNGRTFPFLRTIAKKVTEGDYVLELGHGTGVLSFAAVLSGAEKVVGIEINPLTLLLSLLILDDLESKGFPKGKILFIWGNALELDKDEYSSLWKRKVDVIISENIYTGMFFELQMKMMTHVITKGVVDVKIEKSGGFTKIYTKSKVIPKSLSSHMQLVEVKDYRGEIVDTAIDIKKQGGTIINLSEEHPYDFISFEMVEIPNVISRVKFKVTKNGVLNGICIFSTVQMMEGDYIDRNENKFLNNDSILFLKDPIAVRKDDLVMVSIAYNASDGVSDIILEVRKARNGIFPEKPDTILNISEEKHEQNKRNFKLKNGLSDDDHIDLSNMGDYEVLRSSSFSEGKEWTWMMDIDYVNIYPYGV